MRIARLRKIRARATTAQAGSDKVVAAASAFPRTVQGRILRVNIYRA